MSCLYQLNERRREWKKEGGDNYFNHEIDINPFAVFEKNTWRCPLCLQKNNIKPNSRYSDPAIRATLPELTNAAVEYDVAGMERGDSKGGRKGSDCHKKEGKKEEEKYLLIFVFLFYNRNQ